MVSLLPLRSPISPGHAREISKNLLCVPFNDFTSACRELHMCCKRSRLKEDLLAAR
jgi:hypothetical protein